MQEVKNLVEMIKIYNFQINNFFDIGSYNGKFAQEFAKSLSLQEEKLYCFEAHPEMIRHIQKRVPKANIFNCAISDQIKKEIDFYARNLNDGQNQGISSLRKRNDSRQYKKIKIENFTLDHFINRLKIIPDCIKIDVEGCTQEVLEGCKNNLQNIKIIHLESELITIWETQYLYSDNYMFLTDNNFRIAHIQNIDPQVNTIWVNRGFLK